MLARLKRTKLGKWLFRATRLPVIGRPLRNLARAAQSSRFDPAHLAPGNVAHNKAQIDILARFERATANGETGGS